ncbi:MAG: sensor domain-containing diguanylate cyclase [Terracidiphilus sp.]|jgi:diguanylate cyclase (GGDEF)-like protein/PAS domain S-box-containing protein
MAVEDTDFQQLAEYSADVICRAGVDMKWRYVSPSSLAVLGWTPEEMMGMEAFALVHPDDLAGLNEIATRNFASDSEPERTAARMRKKDGTLVWIEFTARVVRDPVTGEPEEAVVTMRDVSERKMLEDELSSLALTDSLTGLANRRAFDEALDREWKRTLREGSQISLLLLDVDHFKELNDRYGHQVGDDCLRAVAFAVKKAVRETDIPARYGGDEIAVILPSTDTPGALGVAEKVRAAVEALRLTNEDNPEGSGWVTSSVGVATALSRQGGTMKMPESLLLAADNALYKAKRKGRNCVATALLVAFKEP